MNVITTDKALNVSKVQTAIDEYVINSQSANPECYAYLQEIRFEPEFVLTMRVFGLIIVYLRNSLLIESTLKFFNYSRIMHVNTSREPIVDQRFMVLDSQAIEHLDIITEKNTVEKRFETG